MMRLVLMRRPLCTVTRDKHGVLRVTRVLPNVRVYLRCPDCRLVTAYFNKARADEEDRVDT